jgi:hypothetical protein
MRVECMLNAYSLARPGVIQRKIVEQQACIPNLGMGPTVQNFRGPTPTPKDPNISESPEPESRISYYRLDVLLFCTPMAEITGNCNRTPRFLSEKSGGLFDID